MAKTKTPFFSFGSRGTVGGVLTAQKRGQTTLLRSTPKPTDPYSLNQAYQRWDYRDYAYLWTLLSNSEKQIYRTKGSRYHITGFSQWMRESLKDLTSLAGRWHLDEKGGAVAYDSSKNNNNGIIHGASPVDGLISGAYSFDGLNDWIDLGNDPSLQNFETKSISLFFKAGAFTGTIRSIYDNGYWLAPYGDRIWLHATINQIALGIRNTLGTYINPAIWFTPDTWTHIEWTWDGSFVRRYLNGVLYGSPMAFTGLVACTPTVGYLGRRSVAFWYDGLIDDFIIYRRGRDETEILRHSKRRYPA